MVIDKLKKQIIILTFSFNIGDAVELAKVLFDNGSKNTVKVLKGGYELFSRLYPFLRTQHIIYMPRVSINQRLIVINT